jgi:hypothetical protein
MRAYDDTPAKPMDREAAYNKLRGYGLLGYQAAELLRELDAWGGDSHVPGVPGVSMGKEGDDYILISPYLVDNRAPLCDDWFVRLDQTEGGDHGSEVQRT